MKYIYIECEGETYEELESLLEDFELDGLKCYHISETKAELFDTIGK